MTCKILVPTDFSPNSQSALRVAIRIAGERKSELVIAHAWYLPALAFGSEPFAFPSDLAQQISDDAKRGLDASVGDAKQAGVGSVSGIMLTGVPPWARIVDVVEADPAFDLVVMGTHGRTGLRRVLLGSVATQVVRHAPCSVLVVRPDGEPAPFTNALVPVDFSAGSHLAIEQATALVRPGGSGITLLHVVEAPVRYAGEAYELEFLRDLDKAASASLDVIAAKLRTRVDVPVTVRIRIGYAGAQILSLLEDDPTFDLVVMGSHGRTGLKRALLGSVAEKVIRHAPCPVLVARDRT
jgi:nucleotide-binding universal stress UspA family protein